MRKASLYYLSIIYVQGDLSRCSRPPVDNKTRVVFKYKDHTNLMGHPVERVHTHESESNEDIKSKVPF